MICHPSCLRFGGAGGSVFPSDRESASHPQHLCGPEAHVTHDDKDISQRLSGHSQQLRLHPWLKQFFSAMDFNGLCGAPRALPASSPRALHAPTFVISRVSTRRALVIPRGMIVWHGGGWQQPLICQRQANVGPPVKRSFHSIFSSLLCNPRASFSLRPAIPKTRESMNC